MLEWVESLHEVLPSGWRVISCLLGWIQFTNAVRDWHQVCVVDVDVAAAANADAAAIVVDDVEAAIEFVIHLKNWDDGSVVERECFIRRRRSGA